MTPPPAAAVLILLALSLAALGRKITLRDLPATDVDKASCAG